MPRRTTTFYENSTYHIFNRGIESLTLFRDPSDYQAFLDSLAYYLVPFQDKPTLILARTGLAYTGTFAARITLYGYTLLPSAFHLIIKQSDLGAIIKFMQRVGTAYSMYFNKKYHRKGTLFEGRFRTKHIDTLDYLLESTKYIHRLGLDATSHQPSVVSETQSPDSPQPLHHPDSPEPAPATTHQTPTSYPRYLNHTTSGFQPTTYIDQAVKPSDVLNHLAATKPGINYRDYVQNSPNIDWYNNLLGWLE